jgi:hypothetical protein
VSIDDKSPFHSLTRSWCKRLITTVTKEIEEGGVHSSSGVYYLGYVAGSIRIMETKTHFPFVRWIVRTPTGRWAWRINAAILLLLLLVTAAVRVRSYLMGREIRAVLHGLAEIRVDQTTEEQLMKTVPSLTQRDWVTGGISHRGFYVHISNESDRLPRIIVVGLSAVQSEQLMLWIDHVADWFGYRFMSFDASVLVQDGKVSQVEYGLANQWVRPQYAGYVGYIVSARSVHAFWLPRQIPFGVSSEDDESPQYRPRGDKNGLYVVYTSDAPSKLTGHAFQLTLRCYWGLRGCNDAREIAPALWQDSQAIQHATYQQLISEKCPDSIIEGRMRYLPDITVLLLKVTHSRRVEVNEEGDKAEDWFTDYKLKEVIRGQSSGSWKNVRFRRTIPSLQDPTRPMANQIFPPTKIGTPVLFFGNPKFYSCRFIPATPSALEIVRKTAPSLKRREDEIPMGLQ